MEMLRDSILQSSFHQTASTTVYASIPLLCYSEIR